VEALALAFHETGLSVEREMPVAVSFRGRILGRFRADRIVGGTVLLEVKACPKLHSSHQAQVLNHLRATVLEVGLLLSFGPRAQIQGPLCDNPRKNSHKAELLED